VKAPAVTALIESPRWMNAEFAVVASEDSAPPPRTPLDTPPVVPFHPVPIPVLMEPFPPRAVTALAVS